MKKLEDFQNEEKIELENIHGGGEMVHTNGKLFNVRWSDAFYDSNGNGVLDEKENSSFSLAVINPN